MYTYLLLLCDKQHNFIIINLMAFRQISSVPENRLKLTDKSSLKHSFVSEQNTDLLESHVHRKEIKRRRKITRGLQNK